MKTTLSMMLFAALALAGCSTYQGGTGAGYDTDYGAESSPPTDFGRGGNRANPQPYDTQSGAILPTPDEDREVE
jgi:hypothetical protein